MVKITYTTVNDTSTNIKGIWRDAVRNDASKVENMGQKNMRMVAQAGKRASVREQWFSRNRVSPRGAFSNPSRGTLRRDECVLEPEIFDIALAVRSKVSSQRVLPAAETASTRETRRLLSSALDMSLTFPLSSEPSVARAAIPLLANVVEHGGGFRAPRFGSR